MVAPGACAITTSTEDHIVFYDCGSNFEHVSCPSCGTELDTKEWQEWMDSDFDGIGFALMERGMRCCGAQHTLHQLRYEFAQGFGRFTLSTMNPGFSGLSAEQRMQFEVLLGCEVRVIYQRL